MKNKSKIYDVIKDLLVKYPELRDNDKKLCWAIWSIEGFLTKNLTHTAIKRDDFYNATSPKTISRTRRMVQQLNIELKPSKESKEAKDKIQKSKGTFVFREQIKLV